MKANELQIGDYVGYLPTWENEDGSIQRDGNPNNPIICKVEMLGGSGAQLYIGEDYFDVDDIELYPIPLTPEILEKNGFKKGQYGYYWKEKLCGYMGQTVDATTPIEINYEDGHCVVLNPHIGRMFQGSISYVHELQRIMMCCGLYEIVNSFMI